jgi:hypothetical protein
MKARRSPSPTKTYKTTERGIEITLKMLEMKIDLAMCMKTNKTMTKCQAKNTRFIQKRSNHPGIDNHSLGFVAENAKVTR